MKKNTSLFVRILACILTVSIGFSSCKQEIKQSQLSLANNQITVPSEGGTFTIDYVLTNPIQDAELTPVFDVEWVHDFTVSETSITFTVDANDIQEARETTVRLSYGDNPDMGSFIISQAAGIPLPFSFTVDNIRETRAQLNIIPEDAEMTYVYGAPMASTVDALGSDEEIINYFVSEYKATAEEYQMTLEDYMTMLNILKSGEQQVNLKGLQQKTGYSLVVFGLNPSCEPLTQVVRYDFTTLEVEEVDMDFDISTEVENVHVKISVNPSNNEQRYFYDAMTQASYDNSGLSIEDRVQEYIDGQLAVGELLGQTLEQVLDENLVKGPSSVEADLNATTDYIAYAVAVNDNGMVCSKAATHTFSTKDVAPSDNTFDIEITSVNVDRVEYTVTVSNQDPYIVICDLASKYTGLTDDQILSILCSGDVAAMVRSGNTVDWANGLSAETEYTIFAFGFKSGQPNTALARKNFVTLSPSDPSLFTFTSEVSNITANGAHIEISGNPETALYYYDVAPSSMSTEDIMATLEEDIDFWVSFGFYDSRLEYMQSLGSRGTVSADYKMLDPETEYRIWAFGVNEETGENATDIMFSEPFTTLDNRPSDVVLTVDFSDYYDVDELAELYPEDFSNFAGKNQYCLPVTLTTSEPVAEIYSNVFLGDLSVYTDNDLKEEMVDNEKSYTGNKQDFILTYDQEVTVVAIAKDQTGHFTSVFRKTITLSKDGVSPAEEYDPQGSTSNAEMISSVKKGFVSEKFMKRPNARR